MKLYVPEPPGLFSIPATVEAEMCHCLDRIVLWIDQGHAAHDPLAVGILDTQPRVETTVANPQAANRLLAPIDNLCETGLVNGSKLNTNRLTAWCCNGLHTLTAAQSQAPDLRKLI